MKRIYLGIAILAIAFVFSGCMDNNAARDNNASQNGEQNRRSNTVEPIRYEGEETNESSEENENGSIGGQGGYIQSRQYGVNESRAQHYTDAYTNEESIRLTESLRNRVDVVQAQVASTEDRIVVGVILKEHADPDTGDKLVEHIERQLEDGDKEVIVYTDDVQWDRMQDLDSRLQAKEMGEQVERLFEDLFQIDDNE